MVLAELRRFASRDPSAAVPVDGIPEKAGLQLKLEIVCGSGVHELAEIGLVSLFDVQIQDDHPTNCIFLHVSVWISYQIIWPF